jgi:hypothetical protein
MENIKYNLFDLFVYALPGSLIVLSISLIQSNFHLCDPASRFFKEYFRDVNIFATIIFLAFSYCTGFISSIISRYFLRVKEYFFPLPHPIHSSLKNSEKYSLVREKSKENFKYIEQWNVLKSFSCNLAATVLFITIIFFLKYNCFSWYYLLLGCFVSIALIFQASEYKRWSMIDLDNTIHKLDLK